MTPAINWSRLDAQLQALNAVNRQADGSCCRVALTQADRAGRDLVVGWMREAGLEVTVDRIGNIIGVQAGAGGAAPVMTGSHIDTVTTGGRFDGAYGVLAGLEVVRTVREAGLTLPRPLAVAVFTNEEGVRFQPDMMGSLVYAGGLPLEAALATADGEGVTLADALAACGYAGDTPCGAVIPYAYVELHVEQGPVLDCEGLVLGAVQNLQGISWKEIVIRGASNHAGTTPMANRRDAAFAAAKTVVFVRDLAKRMGGAQVGTVGSLQLSPNLVNVVAREARFTVDLRNTDDGLLRASEMELGRFLDELVAAEGLSLTVRELVRTGPVEFDRRVLAAVESAGEELGRSTRRMTSGAGHDAQMMARICPSGMIFVPSIDGISHNPKENTRDEHLEIGANTLLMVMIKLANGFHDA